MTLVEVMVAAALMGGVALVTAKLMGDQASSQAFLKTKSAIATAVLELETHLNKSERCKQMLGGKISSASGTPIGVSGTLDNPLLSITTPTGIARTVLQEKNYGLFRIDDNSVILKNSAAYGSSAVELVINFAPTSKTSFFTNGREIITKSIPIVVQKSGSTIVECGPVLSDANDDAKKMMCLSLGTAANWDGTNCHINQVKCPYGFVAVKMTSLGFLDCKPLATQINLNDIFDTTTVASCGPTSPNLSIVKVGTKFQIQCSSGGGGGCMADGTPCDNNLSCGVAAACTACCNPPADVCAPGGRNHGWCGTTGAPCTTNGMCSY